jgi:hypothetical protein
MAVESLKLIINDPIIHKFCQSDRSDMPMSVILIRAHWFVIYNIHIHSKIAAQSETN